MISPPETKNSVFKVGDVPASSDWNTIQATLASWGVKSKLSFLLYILHLFKLDI